MWAKASAITHGVTAKCKKRTLHTTQVHMRSKQLRLNLRIKPRMYVRRSNVFKLKKLHSVSRNWRKENYFCSMWAQLYKIPLICQHNKWSSYYTAVYYWKNINFIYSILWNVVAVCFRQSNLLLYDHGFSDVSVTLCGVSVRLSK